MTFAKKIWNRGESIIQSNKMKSRYVSKSLFLL